MHGLMNEGEHFFITVTSATLFFSFPIRVVTNDTTHDSSAATTTKSPGVGRRRKIRRVRSLVKSSVEKLTDEKGKAHQQKKSSSTVSMDKRPFPFGQW